MLSPRERQIQAVLANQALEEFEREVAVTDREKQVGTARLDAAVAEICAQQGHVWRGRICANCGEPWDALKHGESVLR